jgi:hypothetical protein
VKSARTPRNLLFALLSVTLTTLFLASASGPAQAAWTCHEVNLGTTNAPEWERICAISGLSSGFGGTFNNGNIDWLYNGDVTNSESGSLVGPLKDTAADGNCVSLWEYYQETPTSSWSYRFPVGPEVCGNGTSKEISCTFNRTSGCTPVLADRTGQITIRLCVKSCEVIWKQDMAVKHS